MTVCLIVDDDEHSRDISAQMSVKLGLNTHASKNGKQALELCSRNMPDVILLDWYMPVMSGLEFVGELRKLPDGEKPKVIFCTAENHEGKIQEAVNAGSDEYIMKPFSSKVLKEKLLQLNILKDAG